MSTQEGLVMVSANLSKSLERVCCRQSGDKVKKLHTDDRGCRNPSVQRSLAAPNGPRLAESYVAMSTSGRLLANHLHFSWPIIQLLA